MLNIRLAFLHPILSILWQIYPVGLNPLNIIWSSLWRSGVTHMFSPNTPSSCISSLQYLWFYFVVCFIHWYSSQCYSEPRSFHYSLGYLKLVSWFSSKSLCFRPIDQDRKHAQTLRFKYIGNCLSSMCWSFPNIAQTNPILLFVGFVIYVFIHLFIPIFRLRFFNCIQFLFKQF